MQNMIKKFVACLLSLAMVFTMIPSDVVRAEEEPGETNTAAVSLKFSAADLEKADITYQVGENDAVPVADIQPDDGGAVWVKDIADMSNIVITAAPKENSNVSGISVVEGEEENAGQAYDGKCEQKDGNWVYTFVATVPSESDSRIYVVSLITNGGQQPGPDNPTVGAGDILFEIGNSQGGNVFYSVSGAGDSWVQMNNNSVVSKNDLTDADIIYVKYETMEGYTLDDGIDQETGMSVNRYYAGDVAAALEFTDNAAMFEYSPLSEYSYRVCICFRQSNNAPDNPGSSFWADKYNSYLTGGINILAQWIGSSQGDIVYEFSDDMTFDNNTAGEKVSLSQTVVEDVLNTLSDPEADESDKNAKKGTLFGIESSGKRYMRIKTGTDLGGSHLGFEIYKKNESGEFIRDDEALANLTYYDYDSSTWIPLNDAQDRKWEDWLKCSDSFDGENWNATQGLILDLSGLDLSQDGAALRCILPFDSRKNISWWNARYKGEVTEAGDVVSEDSWVENGMVELTKVTSKDGTQVYYSSEQGWEPDPDLNENLVVNIAKAGYDNGELRPGYDGAKGKYTAEEMLEAAEKASGQCNVPNNSIVTVKLTPDAGYQILAAELNGMPLTPDAGTQSMFSFEITSNIHFSAMFEKTSDVVSVEGATEVSAAKINGTTEVVDSGNVALTVEDQQNYDDSKALEVVDGTSVASLNVEVDQIVAKAGNLTDEDQSKAKEGTLAVTDDNFWTTNLTELDNPVEISLTLDEISVGENENLALVRDHNGQCEEIAVDVKVDNGETIATFSSDKFSTYTLIKVTKGPEPHDHIFVARINEEITNQIVSAATCTEPAIYKKYCTVCNALSDETFTHGNALGHSFHDGKCIRCKKDIPNETPIREFIERLYSNILGRKSDEDGIANWTKSLIECTSTGVSSSYGFVFSDEFKNRGLSNDAKVEILYLTFLNRTADTDGKKFWVDALNAGVDMEKVYEGFVMSTEFAGICSSYGISQGQMNDVEGMTDILARYRNLNFGITKFVARCYTEALGRQYDINGVEDWCRQIVTGNWTPRNVASGFIHSEEFVNKNTTTGEYVNVLYKTFLGRECDADGYNMWVGLINSGEWTRDQVMDGFAESTEFGGILAGFGLN